MAQIVSRSMAGPVVTVAELMRRCAPAPEMDDDDAAPIPVAALLRREGRSSAGLPAADAPAVGELLSALPARQPLLRRGAIAAGALLAAGSVFGLTAAMNAPVDPADVVRDLSRPGRSLGAELPLRARRGPGGAVHVAAVAFPTLFPEANAPAAPRPPVRRAAAAPAAPGAGGTARPGSASGSPATSTRSDATKRRQQRRRVGGTVETVGNTVEARWAARAPRSRTSAHRAQRRGLGRAGQGVDRHGRRHGHAGSAGRGRSRSRPRSRPRCAAAGATTTPTSSRPRRRARAKRAAQQPRRQPHASVALRDASSLGG